LSRSTAIAHFFCSEMALVILMEVLFIAYGIKFYVTICQAHILLSRFQDRFSLAEPNWLSD